MQPFLERLARHLQTKYKEEVGQVCVIFPSRRAGLFFRQYFSRIIDKPIWPPTVFALEDFVVQQSGLKVPDSLSLQIGLYKSYQQIEGERAKPFPDFLSWGSMILSDFDEIDQNMADGVEVFSYLDEMKAMKLWNPDGSPLTDFEQRYLSFYQSLSPLYQNFRKTLLSNGEAYFGLAFSELISHLDSKSFDEWNTLVFAGFNALTGAEEKLIQYLIKEKKAEIFWDADEYYLNDTHQEAGRFLRHYFKEGKFGEAKWIGNSLKNDARTIEVIGIPGNVGQAKHAGTILSELIKHESPSDIAVVLVDEGLMLPVMNSIPEELQHFNITMGFPLKYSPVYSLFDSLFTLVINARRYAKESQGADGVLKIIPRFHIKDIQRLLNHPYFSGSTQSGSKARFESELDVLKVFVYSNELLTGIGRFLPGLTLSFSEWISSDPFSVKGFIRICLDLIEYFKAGNTDPDDENGDIDEEFLFPFSETFKRLMVVIEEQELIKGIDALYQVFQGLVSTMRLPFYGEPLKGLQMMGVLETRVLDFKNLILVSVNEGLLPRGKQQSTFVPDEIRRAYGLQRYTERNAVFAYHFYRMIQGAENIYLLYNTEGTELGGGEKSRFITQILHELPGYNPSISLSERILSLPPVKPRSEVFQVDKEGKVLQRLLELAEKGFSPSSLSRYLSCPLQFCYSQIFQLKELEEPEESIDAATLGTAVHKVLEDSYAPYAGKSVNVKIVEAIKSQAIQKVKPVMAEFSPASELESGKNLLILKVAESMVRRFFEAEVKFLSKQPEGKNLLEIVELEKWLDGYTSIVRSGSGEELKVGIHGKADRIDRIGHVVRVIDYKTGVLNPKDVKLEKVSDLSEHGSPSKLIQLLTYAWLSRKMGIPSKESGLSLSSGIISLRAPSKYLVNTDIGGEDILQDKILDEFEEILKTILSEIFDESIPFLPTSDFDVCKNCAFQIMCNRVIN
ncbi:MAG: PD-(D/E)XK nuclease family protein [Bacteroidales bacterium]|nr:PD-(D/E)XK nuclease family protein [Bacteroidales bacterium]